MSKPLSSNQRTGRKRHALGIMTKAPRAGAVKTRLVPWLTPEEAAELSACFLRDTTANIARVAAERNADVWAVYIPESARALYEPLLPDGIRLLPQRGESLGERLCNAAEELLNRGYESLCLINADSPTLPPKVVSDGLDALERPGARAVLGPADDGGYYLIGLKAVHRRVFDEIEWSTSRVLSQTIERTVEINLEVELLPSWYDVDDMASLFRLYDEMFLPNAESRPQSPLASYEAPHTRDYIARLAAAGRFDRRSFLGT